MWPFKKKPAVPELVQLFIRYHDGTHLIESYDYASYERMRYLLMVTSLYINDKKVKEIQLIRPKTTKRKKWFFSVQPPQQSAILKPVTGSI